MKKTIYLDHNATTPVRPEVLEAMLPYLKGHYGNPSSLYHLGQEARKAVDRAREQVAHLLGVKNPEEIAFTSGGSESINWAIKGIAAVQRKKGHIVTTKIEHSAGLNSCKYLESRGWQVTYVGVDWHGRVDPAHIREAILPETVLVSVMHANNEVGTIQPIAEIARITRERGVLLHTDAAQSAGKIPIDVVSLGVDLLTLAGHKFYASKGVGALYVRAKTPLRGISFGADHEHGLRPGTENVAAIAGLGVAARLARARLPELGAQLRARRDQLHALLSVAIPGLILNGHPLERLPNTLHVSFPAVSGRRLLAHAAHIVAASLGSACHSEHDAVSGVLAAMGADSARAAGAVRLSVGAMTTADDVQRAAQGLLEAWKTATAA